MQLHFDTTHFLADLREVTSTIRKLKRGLGVCWQRPMAAEQRELYRLKLRATELCALRAWTRGKLHLRHVPHGFIEDHDPALYHRHVAERLGPVYSVPLEQSA